jgi:inorganic pyrophosphatase
MSLNLLHDIPLGKKAPEVVTCVVEINKGSKNKYELDKETGLIKLDRVMHTGQDYPFDYGFFPRTHWHDGDPLDAVILTTYPLIPGTLVDVRPVAMIDMVDGGEGDAKIVAVPADDPRFDHIKDLQDVNPHTVKEIVHFFETYKKLQKKEVQIKGVEGAEEAKKAIVEGIKLYEEMMNDKKN